MKVNSFPSHLRQTRDDRGEAEPQRERTAQYVHARQVQDDRENGILSGTDRSQALVLRTDPSSEFSDSSLSLTTWRNHGDDMVRQAHESVFIRSSNALSPLYLGNQRSTTPIRERRNNVALIQLIDEALAILEDDSSDEHNDSSGTLGSQFRKQ
jgi:hypothetical protein